MLCKQNCTANITDKEGRTPYVTAIMNGHKDAAKQIREHVLQKRKTP
jgi:ankyrin repeat protein